MNFRITVSSLVTSAIFAMLFPFVSGCRRTPAISFSQIPPAGSGGSGNMSVIRGRVNRKHHERHLFLYSFADGSWWIQPFTSTPSTSIAADGSWSASIHLGTEYAAVLSRGDALPPQILTALPVLGGSVEAVERVKADASTSPLPQAPIPSKILRFSGIDWKVRTIPGDYGAKTNEYKADNVFVDDAGALHLRLSKATGTGWVCSEVRTLRSFGYGQYTLRVDNVGHLEPAVMLSAFTLFHDPKANDHRGIDIHITRRGVESNTNAEFVVQPSFLPTNFYHFEVPSGPIQLDLNWQPEEADFMASTTRAHNHKKIASWAFRTGVPKPDDTNFYINLCTYGYAPAPATRNTEIVVRAFEFFP